MTPRLHALQDASAWSCVPEPNMPVASWWRRVQARLSTRHNRLSSTPAAFVILEHPDGHRIKVAQRFGTWIVRDPVLETFVAEFTASHTDDPVPPGFLDPAGVLARFQQDLTLVYGAAARARLEHVLQQIRFLCIKNGILESVTLYVNPDQNVFGIYANTTLLDVFFSNSSEPPGSASPLHAMTSGQKRTRADFIQELLVRSTLLHPDLAGHALDCTSNISIDPPASAHSLLALMHQGNLAGWFSG